ncbi:MAG TPA: adenosylcobinamide-GDP ribazoletransferase [Anaerolineaceae bacterium]|nr:adenosylcobinamide-GDP ribazoletransferase [Anaerolineaceae bacterium]
MKRFRLALSFLTTLPVSPDGQAKPGDLGWAAVWFPIVGLVIGLILSALGYGLAQIFPIPLAGGLVTAAWALLTGALHLDGLADCCDGLFPAVSRERRLKILRDPHLGSFGAAGLALFLILKTAAVSAVIQSSAVVWPWQPLLGLSLAPVLARWLILPVGRQPLARSGGLGSEFSLGLKSRDVVLAAPLPLLLVLASGWRGLLAATLAALASFGAVRLALSRLDGITGDVLGLVVELSELMVLLAFSVNLPV